MLGILGAMDIEVDGLKAMATNVKEKIISGKTFISGKIHGKDVVIAKCGIGKVNAALGAEAMILKYNPDLIINTGVAGSLTKDLSIGDIVIADSVCQHDFDTSPLGDPVGLIPEVNLIKIPADNAAFSKLEAVIAKLGLKSKTGAVASGDAFIASSEKKDYIVSTFGALACEMEGASIGQVCAVNKTPFAVLRALSDSADEGSCEDYPTFCKLAAKNSIDVISEFIKAD
ncbi:MAG: 5'-methylthioadenosine/adenosylhomocysteine nucleosidase [Eubacteriales bacterium]|nr:5'-methylthioadenosine/adenosylhomocysteine nucleosidase [Eubacteriales bacterium]